MSVLGVIPARYNSTRFPGKPLIDVDGKPMIQRVYERSKQCKFLSELIVATDDQRIMDCVLGFGGKAIMTSTSHQNGTERCGEVIENIKGSFTHVVNIQGDEPYIFPAQIDQLIHRMMDSNSIEICTLTKKIQSEEILMNTGVIKVVFDQQLRALYFSRSIIPFNRDVLMIDGIHHGLYYKHIGLYGYRIDILEKIVKLKPTRLEVFESLEQLRWLENGYGIHLCETDLEGKSVDIPEDLQWILKNIHLFNSQLD